MFSAPYKCLSFTLTLWLYAVYTAVLLPIPSKTVCLTFLKKIYGYRIHQHHSLRFLLFMLKSPFCFPLNIPTFKKVTREVNLLHLQTTSTNLMLIFITAYSH